MKGKELWRTLEEGFPGKVKISANPVTDFGGIEEVVSPIIFSPRNAGDISTLMRLNQKLKAKISIRGSAHTTGGQTLSDEIIIDITTLDKIIDVDASEKCATLSAGVYWYEVVAKTLEHQLVPPTYSDWLYLTVGGTISTGGIGQRTCRRGTQADNILEAEVVLTTGEIIIASDKQNKDIFNAIRGGLGLYGVITKVVVTFENAPKKVCVAKLMFKETNEFLSALKQLTDDERIDAIQAHAEPCQEIRLRKRMNLADLQVNSNLHNRVFVLEATRYIFDDTTVSGNQLEIENATAKMGYELRSFTLSSFSEHVTRVPPILDSDLEVEKPEHHHACFFIPFGKAYDFLTTYYSENSSEADGLGVTLLIPILNSLVHQDISLRLPEVEFTLFIGILRRHIPGLNTLKALDNSFEKTLDLATMLGGKVYHCGSAVHRGPTLWSNHFSADQQVLKQKLDPNNVLSPGVCWQSDKAFI